MSGSAGRGRTLLAIALVIPFALPFVWLIASAFKPVDQFYASPPSLFPNPPSLANLAGVLALLDVPRLVANSSFIAVLSVVATVLSSAVVGYAFATLPARGRRPLFAILIATIVIPPTVALVPQFILFSRLGWVGSYLPLIVPSLFGNAFFIFLFRQWFRNLPPHLFESAELDGATPLQAFRHIALPLAGPAVAAVSVFAFVASWNDVHYSVAMALIALIPPVVIFIVAERFLVRGVATIGWRG